MWPLTCRVRYPSCHKIKTQHIRIKCTFLLQEVCPQRCVSLPGPAERQKFYRNDFTSANPQFHSNQIFDFDVETTNNKSVRYNLVLIGLLLLQIKSVLNKTATFIIFRKSVNVQKCIPPYEWWLYQFNVSLTQFIFFISFQILQTLHRLDKCGLSIVSFVYFKFRVFLRK